MLTRFSLAILILKFFLHNRSMIFLKRLLVLKSI